MNCGVWKQAADLVIQPDVNGYKYDAFEYSAELVRAGEVVTRAALPEIRKWMSVDSQAKTKVSTPAVTQPAVMPADL
jgi:hypothetical protein